MSRYIVVDAEEIEALLEKLPENSKSYTVIGKIRASMEDTTDALPSHLVDSLVRNSNMWETFKQYCAPLYMPNGIGGGDVVFTLSCPLHLPNVSDPTDLPCIEDALGFLMYHDNVSH